jgi:dTDP-4-dehydrorhamnose reductase
VKFLVLGANGQLGRDLCPRLPGEVIPAGRAQADLTDPDSLRVHLDEVGPDVVVNCAAYNFVDRAESEPQAAFTVNSLGVRNLARLCAERDQVLVHFSTDYVFGLDAQRAIPWCETDSPGPVSAYGVSKLAGEYFVRAHCPKHFVIRTCGLYGVWGSGGKGGNFIETMLKLADQGKTLRVVADQQCTPTYTSDLSKSVVELIATRRYGLYHVTNSGSCSWHVLASAIFRLSGMSVPVQPITSAEFGAAARRPAYSVLSLRKMTEIGLHAPRPWSEALAEYLRERKNRIP